MTKIKFTKREIEKIEVSDERQVFYDTDYTGLSLRVQPSGKKSFYFGYRPGRGRAVDKKWVMLGTFPVMTVEQARVKAKETAASIQQGIDPAREVRADKAAATMQIALQAFFDEHVSKLKPGSIRSYTTIITKHLMPAFGKIRVKDMTYSDIAKLHHSMKATPYLANRSVAVLSKFFSWCELHGHRERGSNPCQGITKYKEHKRQDFMGEEELSILANALDTMEQNWLRRQFTKEKRTSEKRDAITSQAAAVIRLLMFTGARVGEIMSLEWDNIDIERGTAQLPDSKTGFKVLQLPDQALAILENIPKINRWVFPSNSACGHMVNLKDAWGDVVQFSGLKGWRIHDLRHAFASMMVNGGASLPIVGKVLGHTNASTTQRYAHLEQNPAHKAVEDAANKIYKATMTKPKKAKVLPFQEASRGN